MNKFKFPIVFIFIALIFAPVSTVFAHESNAQSSKEQAQQLRQEAKDNREERITTFKEATAEQRCTIVEDNVNRLVTTYNADHSQVVDSYEHAAEKIENILNELENKAYDTTEARSALSKFNSMIVDLDAVYETFISTLQSTKDIECGNGGGEYKNQVQQAVAQLSTIKQQIQLTEEYYFSDVKPVLLELKNQKTNGTPST